MYLSGHDHAGHRYHIKKAFNESKTNNMNAGHVKVVADSDNFNRSRFKSQNRKAHGVEAIVEAGQANQPNVFTEQAINARIKKFSH